MTGYILRDGKRDILRKDMNIFSINKNIENIGCITVRSREIQDFQKHNGHNTYVRPEQA